MMKSPLARNLLHLSLHIRVHLEYLPELMLFDDQQMTFTVNYGCAISPQELVVREHHLHFSEVCTLRIHVKRHDHLWGAVLFGRRENVT
jgi:hypothetical protein